MKLIRKISVGQDYKNEAMHYAVGQEVYGGHKICDILDKIKPKKEPYNTQITFVNDRPGHDFRYAIDASKIESELGWIADENFESGIVKTIKWYIKKYKMQ